MKNTVKSEDSPEYGINSDDAVIAAALGILARRNAPGQLLGSPNDVMSFLRLKIGEIKNEVFGCIYVDTRHRVIKFEELFAGTIDGASVWPRVVVQRALEVNAAAVFFYHNHPSGVVDPSAADRALTNTLKAALSIVDIRVLDHFIVSHSSMYSFAEHGVL